MKRGNKYKEKDKLLKSLLKTSQDVIKDLSHKIDDYEQKYGELQE